MSALLIRSILETALAAMSPSLATAYENADFTVPAPDVPYQRVHLLMADPAPVEQSGAINREQGFMQVTLCYPLNAGPAAAATRAELIRTTFYRGLSLTSGGATVTIERLPEIAPGMVEDDRYTVPVRIRFYSFNTRS